MLFDLRGGGRRRTIQIVYISLAVIMGAGLVLFGIGGAVSGGLVDAITNNSGSSTVSTDTYQKAEARAAARTRANPKDAAAWAALARARFQLANAGDNVNNQTGQYSAQGQRILASAGDAWQKHLQIAGDKADSRVAGVMVQAYSALGDAPKAVEAQEVVTEARPKAPTFATLAILAYGAGQTRKADLARQKALELVAPDQRETLKAQIDEAKAQAAQTAIASPTATPTATKKDKSK